MSSFVELALSLSLSLSLASKCPSNLFPKSFGTQSSSSLGAWNFVQRDSIFLQTKYVTNNLNKQYNRKLSILKISRADEPVRISKAPGNLWKNSAALGLFVSLSEWQRKAFSDMLSESEMVRYIGQV